MNGLRSLLCALGIVYSSVAFTSDSLKINEFMASNIHARLSPDYSDFEDWIEIYNAGSTVCRPQQYLPDGRFQRSL